jgi:hypothetical protein
MTRDHRHIPFPLDTITGITASEDGAVLLIGSTASRRWTTTFSGSCVQSDSHDAHEATVDCTQIIRGTPRSGG